LPARQRLARDGLARRSRRVRGGRRSVPARGAPPPAVGPLRSSRPPGRAAAHTHSLMLRAHPLAREAVLSAAAAASLAALLVWLGPPGTDLAAHAYQRWLFLQHGFTLWNNFWYAGRYSFVTYSLLYYPLAALVGIRALAVASVALGAGAFAVVTGRQWGTTARWSSRVFAVVWGGAVLTAAFPFTLGTALALLALRALQTERR